MSRGSSSYAVKTPNGAPLGFPVCLRLALVYAHLATSVCRVMLCCPSLVTGGHSGWGAAAPRPRPYIQFPMLDEIRRIDPTYILIVLRSIALNLKASYRC